jgi:uncharacterized protein YbjT (DUF2867 family)
MHLLILGGTVFLGRHLVESALARGHRVTTFHRGREGVTLPASRRSWETGAEIFSHSATPLHPPAGTR